MLTMRDISKIYTGRVKTTALKSINMTISAGEFVAVVGPSGSGKSTLMNIMGLLDRPTTGRYWIDGVEVGRFSDRRLSRLRNQTLGFVHQHFNLISTLSARENVELPLIYRSVSPRERKLRAEQWLDRVGLADRLHYRPAELSGGQQQRVAIARALIGDPKILLADEPTGNLDDVSARDVSRVFDELHEEGQTIVLITHDRRFASAADRVLLLTRGTLNDGVVASYAN